MSKSNLNFLRGLEGWKMKFSVQNFPLSFVIIDPWRCWRICPLESFVFLEFCFFNSAPDPRTTQPSVREKCIKIKSPPTIELC
jgi:hypothetical protein